MLDYLVASVARRKLLTALWRDHRSGSVSELARLNKLSFRSAHKELNEMRRMGLAECTRVGNATVFKAADRCPYARTLRSLVAPAPTTVSARLPGQEQVRANLKAWGAPVDASPVDSTDLQNVESVLVQGVKLARTDASVARSLPVLIWKNRGRLDPERLRGLSQDQGDKHAVGFFLALTGTLANDATLANIAERFRDRRRRAPTDFFQTKRSSYETELSDLRTPPVARTWQFRMNMSMQTFSSTFEKFTENASLQSE